ncbi:hypothetical protein LOD99_14093 [Oopsacas minuta]|uniref:Uncharacterized protein n=1 Tax=Oopsacas minuta TaxID=111878 RepID=A0AAV7KHC3_9METZ|nr:hypothetical protein LOD99_14093 [Oopsacas minuta]
MVTTKIVCFFNLFVLFLTYQGCNSCDDFSCYGSCNLVWKNVCYQFFSRHEQWTDANSSCTAWGGELVSLSSQQELNTVSVLFDDPDAWTWTSLTNLKSGGDFTWADMSILGPLVPKTSSSNTLCGYIQTQGGTSLELSPCTESRPFVCSKRVLYDQDSLMIDGRRFEVFNSAVRQHEASNDCIARNSYLASIKSMREVELLHNILDFSTGNFWIGLVFRMTELRWRWEDASEVEFINQLQEPQTTMECVSMAYNKEWEHRYCNNEYLQYICSVEAALIQPPGLSYSVIAPSTIEVNWKEIPLQYRHSPITQYTLNYYSIESYTTRMGSDPTVVNVLDSYTFSTVISELKMNVSYFFSLSADTKVSTSPQATLLVRLDKEIAQEISTQFISQESACISWLPFSDIYQLSTSYNVIVTDNLGVVIASDVTYTTAYYISDKLSPNTHYSISVSSSALEHPVTITHSFTTPQQDILQSLNLIISSANSTSLSVSWSAPSTSTGDNITHFLLIYSSRDIDTEKNVTLDANTMSYTINGLEEYITYTLNVTSYTQLKGKNGESLEEFTTLQTAPIGTPRSLNATALSVSISLITWQLPGKLEINGKLTNFTLFYSSKKDNGPKNIETTIPVTDGDNNFYFILQGLTNGGPDYEIRLAVNNEAGRGPFANTTAKTLHSGSLQPLQLGYNNVTATSIHVKWESPYDEDIDGIPKNYILTYQGTLLDTSIHELSFEYINNTFMQEATLENLEEDTNYTIQVFLNASGIRSKPDYIVVSTEDAAPSAPVKNLSWAEASQYSVLITWQPVPISDRNGEILHYNITTHYTDPANTSIPQLIDNFTWRNQTDQEFILLLYLWHSVNFTVTVIPYNRRGYGPEVSTSFYLREETIPEILEPETDMYFAGSNASEYAHNYNCSASGNPIPLVNWYRKDGIPIPNYITHSPILTIYVGDLLVGKANEYICNASNRMGNTTRQIYITILNGSVSVEVLNSTLNLVEEQEEINGGQAVNVVGLVDVSLETLPTDVNASNSTENANLILSTGILPPVTTKLVKDSLNDITSRDIFSVNAKAIEVSLDQQNPLTQFYPTEEGCIYREAFYDTEITIANTLQALEALVPKVVAAVGNTTTNFTIPGDSDSFIEAVEIVSNISENIIFPQLKEYNITQEHVVVPSDVFTNESTLEFEPTLVTTTIIKSKNNTKSNGIISLSFTQRSYNASTQMDKLRKEVLLFFPSEPAPAGTELVCLFFDVRLGKWSGEGVKLIEYNYTTRTAVCGTMHLSSFSVLIQTKDPEVSLLEKILLSTASYTLLSISFLSLLAIIVIYLKGGRKFISSDKSEINVLYLNQTIALLFATTVFIFGIESTAKINKLVCTIVAVLLQYLWTAVMAWCMCIGIYLLFKVFIDKWSKRRIWIPLMIFGWSYPVPFVLASIIASKGTHYIKDNTESCFMSTDDWLIWTFLGPVYLVIFVNIIIFICTFLRLIHLKKERIRQGQEKLNGILRSMLIAAIILTFVLGIPWVISCGKVVTHLLGEKELSTLVIDKILNWSFLIFNSPVGIVLLIIVVLKYREHNKEPNYLSSKKTEASVSQTNAPMPKANRRRVQSLQINKCSIQDSNEIHVNGNNEPYCKSLAMLENSVTERMDYIMDISTPTEHSTYVSEVKNENKIEDVNNINRNETVVPSSSSLENFKVSERTPKSSLVISNNNTTPVDNADTGSQTDTEYHETRL